MQFLLSCFYRNHFFSTTFTLQRENFEISIHSLHRELWRRIFLKTCSISFGLHDINTDAHDFYNWAQKEEENSTIKFLFLSVDDYERLLSFLSETCNGNEHADASMKRHAAFPSTPNKSWVRNTWFCQNCFGHLSSLKQHAMVGEWLTCSERGIP